MGSRRTTLGAGWLSVAGIAAPPVAGRTKTPVVLTLPGSSGSLKTTSTIVLMSTPSVVSAGVVAVTVGKDSSRMISPKSSASALTAMSPLRKARPLCAVSVAFTDQFPCGTGASAKCPSAPTICRMAPCKPLRDGNSTTTSVPAARVVPSSRSTRPTTVPLAVSIRFRVVVWSATTAATVSDAAKPSSFAVSSTGRPTGRLGNEKAPSAPTTTDSLNAATGSANTPWPLG